MSEKESYEIELRQVRAFMRHLSADLKGLREELAIQERRMDRLIAHKESLEREMVEVTIIKERVSGKTTPKGKAKAIEDMSKDEALALMKALLENFPQENDEEENPDD